MKKQRRILFEVGLRQTLFDGTTTASLSNTRPEQMARTVSHDVIFSIDPFHFNSKASILLILQKRGSRMIVPFKSVSEHHRILRTIIFFD